MVTELPATSSAATSGKAAEDGSPGTTTSAARSSGWPCSSMIRPAPVGLDADGRAEMAQHVLAVVARGLRFLDPGDAGRVQAGEQHRRLHLRRRNRHAIVQRQRVARALDRQRQAAAFARRRTARRSRSADRSPGASAGRAGWHRRSSPRTADGWPGCRTAAARRCRNCPCRARRPVRVRPPMPRPATRQMPSASCVTSAPRARMAAAVRSTSSPVSRPVMRVSPIASAPNIRARWLIDLSPGTAIRPCQRGGRFAGDQRARGGFIHGSGP